MAVIEPGGLGQWALEILHARGPVSRARLGGAAQDVSQRWGRKVGFVLRALRRGGLVKASPQSVYALTEAGRRALGVLRSGRDVPLFDGSPGVRRFAAQGGAYVE